MQLLILLAIDVSSVTIVFNELWRLWRHKFFPSGVLLCEKSAFSCRPGYVNILDVIAEITAEHQNDRTPWRLKRRPDSKIEEKLARSTSGLMIRRIWARNFMRNFSAEISDLRCDSARLPAVSRSCAVFMHGMQLQPLAL